RLSMESGNLSQALEEVRPLVSSDSPQPAAIELKIKIQRELQDIGGAAESLVVLGDAYAATGNDERALDAYRESLTLQPENIEALQRQAEVTRRTQGVNAALPLYREWINVAKQQVPGAQVVSMLEEVLTFAPD